jgi:hypothetical protein
MATDGSPNGPARGRQAGPADPRAPPRKSLRVDAFLTRVLARGGPAATTLSLCNRLLKRPRSRPVCAQIRLLRRTAQVCSKPRRGLPGRDLAQDFRRGTGGASQMQKGTRDEWPRLRWKLSRHEAPAPPRVSKLWRLIMKLAKSLFLGSAAALATVAGAQSPDRNWLSGWGEAASKGLLKPALEVPCGPQPLGGSIAAMG